MTTPRVTFIVPCLNEEDNLEATLQDIRAASHEAGVPYEILVIDDASTDGTGKIADRLAAADLQIRAIHNAQNRGLGANYFIGVDLAQGQFVMMVPGDHEIPLPAIRAVLAEIGKADMIIPYMTNLHTRPLARRLVSLVFTRFSNVLFGLSLKYYNGPCLLRTDLVKGVTLRSEGFAYAAAVLVLLQRSGASYREVPISLLYRQHGRSNAVTWKNIRSVIQVLWRLTREVHGPKRSAESRRPTVP